MTITITVPDNLATRLEARATAGGVSLEEYVLSILEECFQYDASDELPTSEISRDYSPLRAMIGLVKNGRSDASVNHDYRPDDPV